MVTKWKNRSNNKSLLFLKYLLIIISFILAGMVFLDINNFDYHFGLIVSAMILFVFDISFFVELSYNTLDNEILDYLDLKKRAIRLLKIQQIIILAYVGIVVIVLFFPREYDTYFSELITYRMTWIILVLLGFVPVAAEICIYFQYSRRINLYRDNLFILDSLCNEMSLGNLNIQNPFEPENLFYSIGKALEQSSRQAATAADRIIKNEKMKADLITNMSHDLKTPLTSMISTLDLLKKMELSDDVKIYTELLSNKSEQLKKMIETLFDISKAGSGTLNLLQEKLDMNRLMNQLLADMSVQVEQRESEIRMQFSEEPLYFLADNQALYQVCQNLLDNALKYSLKNTRIYIKTFCDEGMTCLKISNTANYEMNFTDEEISERFVRGDTARTTDGNGLGLAIAKTYTEACKGIFNIGIEGDQFWAMVRFKQVLEKS